MTNSLILENIDAEGLKALIREVVAENFQTFQKPLPVDRYLTRAETAKELRVSLPTLNELTKSGKLKGYRIGGRVLYKFNEISTGLNPIRTKLR